MNCVSTKKLLLAGAGHAHIDLLRSIINSSEPPKHLQITLVTEQPQTIYSGMLPGWMAGHYNLADISIDAQALCEQAGVTFIQQSLAKVDAASGIVTTADDKQLDYDVLSLNTGANTDLRWLNKAQDQLPANTETAVVPTQFPTQLPTQVVAVRPISLFIERWQQIIEEAKQSACYQLAVVGAGAAATELVLAAQYALRRINPNHQAYLVCGDELLSGFNQRFKKQVIKQLHRHKVQIVYERALGYSEGQLHTSRQPLAIDALIAATGVTGSAWTKHTDLSTVDHGFIAVNEVQQSISHPNVFAVGDVATRVDQKMAHSGVHAVRGGAVEADNLLAYLADQPLHSYDPRLRTLYLLSCGDKYAIASWGDYSLQGRWVWQLKKRIDKRFVKAGFN